MKNVEIKKESENKKNGRKVILISNIPLNNESTFIKLEDKDTLCVTVNNKKYRSKINEPVTSYIFKEENNSKYKTEIINEEVLLNIKNNKR